VVDNNLKNTNKVKDIIKGQFDNGLAKKIDLDRIIVRNLISIHSTSTNFKCDFASRKCVKILYGNANGNYKIIIPKQCF
jgi:outer membrane protein